MTATGQGRLAGRGAVITGAASGIGRAMAAAFVEEGARVLVADIDGEAAERAARELDPDATGAATGVEVDVTRHESVAALAERALASGPIEILCNNAGIFDDYRPVTDTPEVLWDAINDVNAKGPYLVSAAFLPGMLERGSGVIINTASIAAVVAGAGGAAYTASKHAILGLSRQMALDHGPAGVRVNAICPGAIATAMSERAQAGANPHLGRMVETSPARRWGTPEEIARVAVFLAGDESSYMHGSTVLADGGWTLS